MEQSLSVNMAMTLDGKVMLPDGTWHGLTSPIDRQRMDEHRSRAQALIVGRNSVEKDNPRFTLRDGTVGPRPVMVCRSRLPSENLRIYDAKPLIIAANRLQSQAGHLENIAELHFSDALSPSDILSELRHRQYDRILLEGGPTLNASYFAADLVDHLFITIVPYILGQNDLPGIVKMEHCIEHFDQRLWTLVQCEKIENEIFTEYHRSKN